MIDSGNSNSLVGAPPLLVEVTRGELVESRHRGWIEVFDPTGQMVAGLGDPGERTWYRSAAKPFQAIPLIISGAADRYRLSPRELSVIIGSHSGEDIHLEAVESILQKAGLSETDLQCGVHTPFDEATAKALRSSGSRPRILHNNCSGKHAGMLALASHLGLPLENYLDPDHPIQREIIAIVAAFTGLPVEGVAVAVDGCSAPVFGVSLGAMALSYARLINCPSEFGPEIGAASQRAVEAMTSHPEMVGGEHRRLDTDLMRALPGAIVSKVGAEGVQLLGILPSERHPKGLGIAIKIEDGDIRRARDPVVIETLLQLGVLEEGQLGQYGRSIVYNHRRREVGEVRPVFDLGVDPANHHHQRDRLRGSEG